MTERGDRTADAQRSEALDLETSAAGVEVPDARTCAKIAAQWMRAAEPEKAASWAVRAVDHGADFTAWRSAARVLDEAMPDAAPRLVRAARVAVLGTSTVTTLIPCLRLALARAGIGAEMYEAPYAQYWQEALDPTSGLRAFDPDIVVLVPDHHALDRAPEVAEPEAWAEDELGRWRSPWSAIGQWSSALVVQLGIAVPEHDTYGNAASTVSGSRRTRLRRLNAMLAEAAADAGVGFVDTEALAASIGKRAWFDARFWTAAKHAFSMAAAPELALQIAGVIAGRLGLGKRLLVVDLDNTLWGGVIGDDGLAGIELDGTRGEAHLAFQHALTDLRARGMVLAVCSKNDPATAMLPFTDHPDMVLRRDDFASFVANWQPKPANIETIAAELSLGLDSVVFVDDNPAERDAVRRALPQVGVLALPTDVATWPDVLGRYPWIEPGGLTDEDRQRAASYRARAAAASIEASAESLEEFQRSLEMTATIEPVDGVNFDRVVQLVNKTNQFNLTTRRHPASVVKSLLDDENVVHLTARLEDRLADHGLVAVVLARVDGDVLDVDTFVMSCRVIGRGLESALIAELVQIARDRGLGIVRGHYLPTDRNSLVADLWTRHGFDAGDDGGDGTSHAFAVDGEMPIGHEITIVRTP